MIIKLFELSENGQDYLWTRETGEVNGVLSDLIQTQDYRAEFSIRPINSKDFIINGEIKTQIPDLCSRCGIDFQFPVQVKFQEILIPPQKQDRSGKYAKVNHISESSEDAPTSSEYSSQGTFDIGEYLHEVVALSLPFNPAPPLDTTEKCLGCGKSAKEWLIQGDQNDLPIEEKTNPFAALKNIKFQQ